MLGLVPPTCFRRDKGVLEVRTRFHPQRRTFVYTSYLFWNDFMEALLQETHVTRVSLRNCAHVPRRSVEALVVRALNLATPAFPNLRFLASNPDGLILLKPS